MELLTFSIAAGETKHFHKAGRYFELIDAAAAVTLGFYDANGSQTDDAIGALSGMYFEAPFSSFEVTSATAQTLAVLLTDGRGGSRRQPGVVRVVDQGVEKTSEGDQHLTSLGQAAVVGANSVFALQPNGRRLVVKKLSMGSVAAGRVQIGRVSSLGTAFGALTGLNCNKLASGAAPAARYALGTTAGLTPTPAECPGLQVLVTMHLPASTQQEVPLTTPLVFDGTEALFVSGFAINRDVAAVVDFEEV